jgi:hypothetical protein
MKSKNLFIVAIILCLSAGLKAQEKYEQAVLSECYNVKGWVLYISKEGQELTEVQIEKGKKKNTLDETFILTQIAQMRNEGWEVWNSTASPNNGNTGTSYFLRRKLK